jgi:hypothetical protein
MSPGMKGRPIFGLTTVPPPCADWLEILETSKFWSRKDLSSYLPCISNLHKISYVHVIYNFCVGVLCVLRREFNQIWFTKESNFLTSYISFVGPLKYGQISGYVICNLRKLQLKLKIFKYFYC